MTIHYSNCFELWEKILFWVPIPTIFVILIAGFMLFSQEEIPSWKTDKKGVIIFELLGPLHPLLTSKYLQPKVVKYRWWFFGSIAVLGLHMLMFSHFQVCAIDT
jgi:cytochrome b subunit of formate dehydrogenase